MGNKQSGESKFDYSLLKYEIEKYILNDITSLTNNIKKVEPIAELARANFANTINATNLCECSLDIINCLITNKINKEINQTIYVPFSLFNIRTHDDREALAQKATHFIDHYTDKLNDKYKNWKANNEEKEFLEELEQLSSIRPKTDSNVSVIDYKDSSEIDEEKNIHTKKSIINHIRNNIAKGSIFLKKRETKILVEEKPKIDT